VRVRHEGHAVSTTAPTIEAARELRASLLQKIIDGQMLPTGGVCAKDLGPKFLASREGHRSSADDSSRWHKHLTVAAWARLPVDRVQRSDGVSWLTELRRKRMTWSAGQGGSKPRTLSWQTRKHCLNLARSFFAWAVEHGYAQSNPFAGLSVQREDGDEDGGYQTTWYLDLDEQSRLVSLWDGFADTRRRERHLVSFALGTGLREGEQWCLHLRDVKLDAASPHIVVRYGSWDRERERYLTPKGRAGSKKERIVPLFGVGLSAAKAWLAQLNLYAPRNPLGLMFPTERGARRDRSPRSWPDAVEAFGIVPRIGRDIWWHLLRHTFASSLVSGWWGLRWPIEDVSKMLGHTDIRTTQIYAHLAPQVVQDTAARAQAAYLTSGHALATPPRPQIVSARNYGRARQDSDLRHSASKAEPNAEMHVVFDPRGQTVAAAVTVLRDIASGRYQPSEPVVAGLERVLADAPFEPVRVAK